MKQNTQGKEQAKTVLTSTQNGVLTITLNRPENLNALSPRMMNEFRKVLNDATESREIRAVIITGAGRAFCAGGDASSDIKVVGKLSLDGWRKYHRHVYQVVKLITQMKKPVVAAVNGVAVGGGCDLAMACDVRIASEDAKFGMFYTRMGILPGWGGTYFMPRQIGVGMAKLLILTGDLIDAREAERIGLVEKVVTRDEFEVAVADLAQKLANGPTVAIGQAKIAINKSHQMDLQQTLDYITEAMYPLLSTSDYKEACAAFFEKRQPVFKGE